jgi:hypothetical protein
MTQEGTQESDPKSPEPSQRCPSPEPVGALVADVNGDGCSELLTYADGQLQSTAGQFTLGGPGDRVVTGRWSCTMPATPAILRRDGRVFIADRWASSGSDVVTRLVATQPGAVDLQVTDRDGDGCDELVLQRSDGSSSTVVPGRSK